MRKGVSTYGVIAIMFAVLFLVEGRYLHAVAFFFLSIGVEAMPTEPGQKRRKLRMIVMSVCIAVTVLLIGLHAFLART